MRWGSSLALLALFAPTPVKAGPTATETVEALHASFIRVMQEADELGFAGRHKALEASLEAAFDLDFMAAKALGSGGRTLGKEDRERWSASFARLLASGYANRFLGYSGQHYESTGKKEAPRGQVVILTRLVRPRDEDIEFDYRLRESPGGWQIIDVYMQGRISLLALRRAEFSSILEREGFEALVTSVESHVASESEGETEGPEAVD